MRWEDACMCVLLGRFDLFSRSKEVASKYDEHKSALQQNKITMEDVILRKMKGADITWIRNDFPYDVAGTRHYVVWSTMPLTDEKIREVALLRVGGREFIQFVNPDERRSVKKLWHAHVLVLSG